MAKEEKKKVEEIQEMDWDDGIEAEVTTSGEFSILPVGEYDFEVEDLEKTFSSKGNKMAKVVLKIEYNGINYKVFDNIVLMSNMKWKIAQFFECLGLKKKGEPLQKMPWDKVVGATGRMKLKHETYEGRESCKVDRYLIAEAAKAPTKPEMPFEV